LHSYDWTIPLLCQTHSRGPDYKKNWGVERVAAFFDAYIAQVKHEHPPNRPVPLIPVRARM
jgi:hypothetical protein